LLFAFIGAVPEGMAPICLYENKSTSSGGEKSLPWSEPQNHASPTHPTQQGVRRCLPSANALTPRNAPGGKPIKISSFIECLLQTIKSTSIAFFS
jgi:hypothetical protein